METITSNNDITLQEVNDAVADLETVANELLSTLDPIGEVAHKSNKVIAFSTSMSVDLYVAHVRKISEKIKRDLQDSMEQARQILDRFDERMLERQQAQLHLAANLKTHRAQSRTHAVPKASSKKSSSSSSGNGGDSGGEGDGPAHASTKKHRAKNNRISSPCHSPNISSGAILPPQFPPPASPSHLPSAPPHRRSGLGYLALIALWSIAFTAETEIGRNWSSFLLAIFALSINNHSDVAKSFLSSKVVSSVIIRILGKDDK